MAFLSGLFSTVSIVLGEKRRVSLAITTYNRPGMVKNALDYPICDRRIDEILIYDDGSREEQYQAMLTQIDKEQSRVKIVRGKQNLGPFTAKLNAVRQCRNDWVILLDSDNSIDSGYVNRIFNEKHWREDTVYCPDFARPSFNFKAFSGAVIDIDKARALLSDGAHNPRFVSTLLNTGNYFLPRRHFVECLEGYTKYRILAIDVLMANYLWMRSGGYLQVVPRLAYNHLVHEGSHFKSEGESRQDMIRQLREAIASGYAVDFGRYFARADDA